MDQIWKAALHSGGQCIGPAYAVGFWGSEEESTAAVLQAANPSLSEHGNCLFNWLQQLGERVLYKRLHKVPPQIPSTVHFSVVICVNTIGFSSSSNSQEKYHLIVVSSKSDFWTLLSEQGAMDWPMTLIK